MNVLYDRLPEEINGYQVNFGFRIGVQIAQVQEDKELSTKERWFFTISLLFGNEDGSIREHPTDYTEIDEILTEYMTGWNKDKTPKGAQRKRLMDYDIDQWRIYADFRQIYGINLNECELHYWEFQALLWNMPYKYSSFLQAVDIRNKDFEGMSPKERKATAKAKAIYSLDAPDDDEPLTAQEESNKAEFMAALERRRIKDQIAKDFVNE